MVGAGRPARLAHWAAADLVVRADRRQCRRPGARRTGRDRHRAWLTFKKWPKRPDAATAGHQLAPSAHLVELEQLGVAFGPQPRTPRGDSQRRPITFGFTGLESCRFRALLLAGRPREPCHHQEPRRGL